MILIFFIGFHFSTFLINSDIKAGNIYQNGRWRANVGDTAEVASEAEAIKYAKQHKD